MFFSPVLVKQHLFIVEPTGVFFAGEFGGFCPLEVVSSDSIEIVHFFSWMWREGEAFVPILMCLVSRKNLFLIIFHNNLNMCFVHIFPMELEYAIYYFSPDAFS